ncbi:protein SAWADEE HOMEODOMAIN HOMOLOG 2 isoform X2 [Sesamum indicum]|uniref:Protein SAWADEE HOMEODOMAIN HOMOLOG 2 isoform X2 n=1 Tax=Sesamum indicum TaxID=4182 RepID=A0A8M8VE51_SESIN|nr:protein SAWADEE HOMEODOMAIN HOMOLOG 2 isoform X2 [Sesamum indicum]
MGRPPSNGGPSFRFNPVEVGEMEAILQAHNCAVPAREILEALAQRFSSSAERAGKVEVSVKQVWNWFQNRRYALRAKAARASVPGQVNMMPVPRDEQAVKSVPQVPQSQGPQPPVTQPQVPQPQVPQPQIPQPQAPHPQAPQAQPAPSLRSIPQAPHPLPAPSAAQNAGRNGSENTQMEFEAKSARDGAWYDVASFLSHRSLETGDPEALVRFAGFGPEEDEWVNIRRHVRQRSLPCESSECVAVLPGDLILCFQEGKEQALYFDAHVLDAQRRRHDVRGCRCRFLVRYDHDQSEEIVPLRKICRRPETDYRLQQLHAMSANMNPQKMGIDPQVGNNVLKVDATGGATQKQPKPEERIDTRSMTNPAILTNVPAASESKLLTSKISDAGNSPAVGNSNS